MLLKIHIYPILFLSGQNVSQKCDIPALLDDDVCVSEHGVKFGIQIGSDYPKMGQIWDFSDLVSQIVLKSYLKKYRIFFT